MTQAPPLTLMARSALSDGHDDGGRGADSNGEVTPAVDHRTGHGAGLAPAHADVLGRRGQRNGPDELCCARFGTQRDRSERSRSAHCRCETPRPVAATKARWGVCHPGSDRAGPRHRPTGIDPPAPRFTRDEADLRRIAATNAGVSLNFGLLLMCPPFEQYDQECGRVRASSLGLSVEPTSTVSPTIASRLE